MKNAPGTDMCALYQYVRMYASVSVCTHTCMSPRVHVCASMCVHVRSRPSGWRTGLLCGVRSPPGSSLPGAWTSAPTRAAGLCGAWKGYPAPCSPHPHCTSFSPAPEMHPLGPG